MNVIKTTVSFCPQCYLEIPATIYIDGVVKMEKECPLHGKSTGIVELDPQFYLWCMNHPTNIYDGHLIDVTTRCNLKCKYCYHDKGGDDVPTALILNECRTRCGPYILTGGEPTLRQDLPEIIAGCSQIGPTSFLTNGTGLLDTDYLKACNEHVYKLGGFSAIGLSYHSEFDGFDQVLENLIACEIRPHTLFFVIDDLEQLHHVKTFAEAHRGMFEIIRIKPASNIWAETGAKQIYASQVLDWFSRQGGVRLPSGGKSTFFPFWNNGVEYCVISWYDATNVDLIDINCPPTYRAKNGQVADFVKAMLINEGMWINGR